MAIVCLGTALLPISGSALCGGGGTSALTAPGLTWLRSYRASFGAPMRLAADAAGNIYVTDPEQGQVVVRKADGRLLARHAGLGRPISIAIAAAGRILVGDGRTGSITSFDADWQPSGQLGRGAGEFGLPNDIAIDSASGRVYVADSRADVVKVYDANGAALGSFGGSGSGEGQMHYPVAVAVDAAAHQLLVVDQLNYRVQSFDLDGGFVSCFGSRGSGPGKFNMPQGLTVDGLGRVYVADSVEGRIQVLDRGGNLVGYVGDFGETAGQLRLPMSMVIDASHRMFVAAANNARLEIFGLDSFTDPERFTPAALTIDPNPIDRSAPGATVSAYLELPGHSLDQLVGDSIAANGIFVAGPLPPAGDHDGNGVPDVRLEFAREGLLATLPTAGSGFISVGGTVGSMQFESTAPVQVTVCSPQTLCSLGGADPQCNEAVCVDPLGCIVRPKNDGGGCEDGNACTVGGQCNGGVCSGEPLLCNDNNPCTDDLCDAQGGCVFTYNTAPCDDANACTDGDVCAAGTCAGTTLTCDDGNPCTDDACDPAQGCGHAANSAPCDDGTACTSGDACVGGACVGTPLACDDGNLCTDDTCDAASGCMHANNSLPCNDGNGCTAGDVCSGGGCHGTTLPCDDGNVCTDDSCDTATGCRHVGNSAPCDDADSGTLYDSCQPNGVCAGQVTTGRYAVLRWPPAPPGSRALILSTHSRIRGDVCSERVAADPSSLVEGNVVGLASAGRAVTLRRHTQVTQDVVTGGGDVKLFDQATVLGRTDQSGTASELNECFAARYHAESRRVALMALPASPGLTLGGLDVADGNEQRIPANGSFGPGQTVVEFSNLRLGTSSKLSLAGSPSTGTVIVHIKGKLRLAPAARIVTDGGLTPEQVTLVVDGSVILQTGASVSGSVFAAGSVHLGRRSTVTGAILGALVGMAPYATVDLHPFVGW